MYALVDAAGAGEPDCWLHAFTTRPAGGRRGAPRAGDRLRRRVRGDALHAQLGAVLRRGDRARVAVAALARATARSAGGCCAPALLAYGGALLLYAPWIPTHALPGRPHRRAVVEGADARRARLGARRGCSARSPRSPSLLAAGAGVWRCCAARGAARRGRSPRCCVIAVRRSCSPGSASQLSPAWANRYLAAGVAPFLLLAAAGFAHAGRLGLVGARARRRAVGDRRRAGGEEQRARRSREAIAPVAAARRPRRRHAARAGLGARTTTCPTGLRYATLTGPVPRRRRDRLARRRRAAGGARRAAARPRAAARRAAARAAARARRADDLRARALERAVDVARPAALGGVARSTSRPTRASAAPTSSRRRRSRERRTPCGRGSTSGADAVARRARGRSSRPGEARRAQGEREARARAGRSSSSSSSPPMRRASSRPIARPSPKPPAEPGRAAAVEALEDAVALLAAGCPGPRSATVIVAWPSPRARRRGPARRGGP